MAEGDWGEGEIGWQIASREGEVFSMRIVINEELKLVSGCLVL
jgi:hypothetical protein